MKGLRGIMAAILGMCVCGGAAAQQASSSSGTLLRVHASPGQITVSKNGQRQVIATVPRETRLYALETKGDFYRVIDPASLRAGWIWKRHAVPVRLSQQQSRRIRAAYDANSEALDLTEARKFHEAEPKFRQALAGYQNVWGDNHHLTGGMFSMLAYCCQVQTRHDEASLLYRKALDIYEKTKGLDDAATAAMFVGLVATELSRGKFAEAEQLARDMINKSERALGKDHELSAQALQMLANCYSRQAQYVVAEPLYRTALEICEKKYGPEHEQTCSARNGLANILLSMGNDEEAISLITATLDFAKKALGQDHPVTASYMKDLAAAYMNQGKYSRAEPLLHEAIEIMENHSGAVDWTGFLPLTSLARIYVYQGKFGAAQQLYQRALDISEKRQGPEHPDTATSLGQLAGFYGYTGRYEDALRLDRRALDISEKIYGPDHPTTATCLHNMAKTFHRMDRVADAAPLYKRSLEICERNLASDHLQTASALLAMASICEAQEDYTDAETFHQRSLKIREKVLGTSHPTLIDNLRGLGVLNDAQRKYESAIPFYKQALSNSERIWGRDDPTTGGLHKSLAYSLLKAGALTKAVNRLDQSRQVTRRYLVRMLPSLSETERRTYLATFFDDSIATALSAGCQNAADQRTVTLSAGWLLNNKGTQQEVAAEVALLAAPDAGPLVETLRAVRSQLSRLSLLSATNPSVETTQKLVVLENQQQQLERQIALHGLGIDQGNPWISTSTLMSKIPHGSVLVNIARFRERNFQNKSRDDIWQPHIYVAWIVPASGAGDVHIVRFGPADVIDEKVEELRTQFQPSTLAAVWDDGEDVAERKWREKATELSKLILAPLEEHLQDAEEVIISPDGALWTVPWEALFTTNNRYLIEEHRTRYVVSGRELVGERSVRDSITNPVIFADPDFDLNSDEIVSNSTHNRQQLRSAANMYFGALRSSAAEAAAIRPGIENYVDGPATVFTQAAAQEATFKELHRPRVLVMSTHGYFEALPEGSDQSDVTKFTNPLLRCGLALAGCNNRGSVKEGAEDGILTGLEIVGTDLRGTELVVLSACETGLGDISNGDGVAGLRQAFQLAGAQSVISSLWQVEDGETARLMKLFFANLAGGMTKSEALRQAQLTRIKVRRERHGAAHPFFWAAFTLTGQE